LFGSGALMIKDFVTMLNYFLKMGSGDRLTPTFIIEPFSLYSGSFPAYNKSDLIIKSSFLHFIQARKEPLC
jgi:hypothetical protein